MRDPYYGRMCFKSVKTLEAVHSQMLKRPLPSASAFSTRMCNVVWRGIVLIHGST